MVGLHWCWGLCIPKGLFNFFLNSIGSKCRWWEMHAHMYWLILAIRQAYTVYHCLLFPIIIFQVDQSVWLRTLMNLSIHRALLFKCNVIKYRVFNGPFTIAGTSEACFNNPFLVRNLCDDDNIMWSWRLTMFLFLLVCVCPLYTAALQHVCTE